MAAAPDPKNHISPPGCDKGPQAPVPPPPHSTPPPARPLLRGGVCLCLWGRAATVSLGPEGGVGEQTSGPPPQHVRREALLGRGCAPPALPRAFTPFNSSRVAAKEPLPRTRGNRA